MKKIFAMLLAVAALGFAMLSSCKSEKPDPPYIPPIDTTKVEAGVLLKETFGTTATGNPSVATYTGFSKTGKGAANVAYEATGTVSVRTTSASSGYTNASGSCNAMMAAAGGAALVVKNIASCGAQNLKLSFGSNQMSDSIAVSYSADNGSTWTPITYLKNDTYWGLVSDIAITLPAGTTCFALKFTGGKTQFGTRIDDITVSTDDVIGEASSCGGQAGVFNETLTTQASFDKFTAVSVSGDQVWNFVPANASYGAQMSGFVTADGVSYANEDWLISPAIDLSSVASASLTFDHARGPAGSMGVSTDNYTLWISTDYTSGAPSTATWAQLAIPTHGTTAWGFVSSGPIELTQLTATTRIAFKYVCSNTESATWEVKNVVVSDAAVVPSLNFTSAATKSGTVGEAFSHTFTVEEVKLTGATSFEITNGTLPAGLTLAGATISGTPTAAGVTPLTVKATNGTVTATQDFIITINEPVAPITDTLAMWSFESAADLSADKGSGTITAPSSLSYTGSSKTIYCSGWDATAGKYWLLTIPVGKDVSGTVRVNFIAFGTNTAPKNWKVQVSSDNATWTDGSAYTLANVAYNHADAQKSVTVTLPATVPNGGTLYIRLATTDVVSIGGGNVAAGGNSRLAELVVGL